MEQKNFCISSLYDLLNPDNINVRISNNKFHVSRPYGLSNLHQINFRDFKGDLLPFTDIELPKLKADLIMMTNGLKTVNFEGENTMDFPAVFSYNRASNNKIISINKAWTYKEEEEDQIIYNIQEIFNLMNNKLKDYFTKSASLTLFFNYDFTSPYPMGNYYNEKQLIKFGQNVLVDADGNMLLYDEGEKEITKLKVNVGFDALIYDPSTFRNSDRTGSILIGLVKATNAKNWNIFYTNEQENGTFLNPSFDFSSPFSVLNSAKTDDTDNILYNKGLNGTTSPPPMLFHMTNDKEWIMCFNIYGKTLNIKDFYKNKSTGSASSKSYELYNNIYDMDPDSTQWGTQLHNYYDDIKASYVIAFGEKSEEFSRIYGWVISYCKNEDTSNHYYLLYQIYIGYSGSSPVANNNTNWGVFPPIVLNDTQLGYLYPFEFLQNRISYVSPPIASYLQENKLILSNIGVGVFTFPMDNEAIDTEHLKFVSVQASFNIFSSSFDEYLVHQGNKYTYMSFLDFGHPDFLENPYITDSYYETNGNNIGFFGNSGPALLYNYNSTELPIDSLGIDTVSQLNVKASATKPDDSSIALNPSTTYLTTKDEELLILKNISGSSGYLAGTAEIPQITFANDYSLNFLLRIYTEPYYFELYTQKNYTQEGNSWNLNVVDSSLFFRSSNEHVLDTLEYLILLNYTYNDIVLKVSGFPNSDQVIFHINETSYINFKTMITDNTTQELIIELLSEEGDILTIELLKKLFGKITLSIDWVQ